MSSFQVENLFNVKDKVVRLYWSLVEAGGLENGFIKNGAKVYLSSRSAKSCEETAVSSTHSASGNGTSSSCSCRYRGGAAWGDSLDDFPDAAFTVPGIYETYAYPASKAALHHLSRHLGGRLGPESTVHSLEAVKDVFTSTIPLHRLGKPEDVAGAALFLASPADAFVNRATITLDGRMLVPMTKL
ncbi:uncharacterized protein BT62DRAFT_1072710 [Guyanagaster necrorhizus]|uniref:Uncharacterized protein n=1 Tax=Guyanagaster necrorhizus TaxID=856835 RepID=A0A9P7W1I7_9AGAR|nr:uncharacterized protein BT62DRAFT_1072710 [Guyanagaster necrorhizus MCA 3950]KAG7450670.1 hypothetical protein BT62DRAFT_1072710 [Guyanagaster necrorhizus MCA 3950]